MVVCVEVFFFLLWLLGSSISLDFHQVAILVKLCPLTTPACFPLINIGCSCKLILMVLSKP